VTDGDRRLTVLATATAANFGQFGARVVVSPFVLAVALDFGVSKGAVGTGLTFMWAAFALAQFPSGVLADRYGERRVMLTSMALTVLGSLLVAVAPSFPAFVLATAALGGGAGLYFAVGTALLARRFENRGRALGLHSAGGPVAGLVVPVAATSVAARYDWRAGVATGAVVAAIAFCLVALFVGETPPAKPDASVRERLRPRSALALLRRPGVAYTAAVATLGMYVFQSFSSFFPAFLQEYHGFGEGEASLAFGLAFILIAVGLPLVGNAADRYGTRAGLVGPFLGTAAGFLFLLAAPTRLAVYAGVVVLGLAMTWGGPLQSRFMNQFSDEDQASGFGAVRTVFVLLGSVGNAVTGVLAGRVGWAAAFGVVVALLLVAAGLVARRGDQNE
jgi:predicted MFS family arabinose efflux permease